MYFKSLFVFLVTELAKPQHFVSSKILFQKPNKQILTHNVWSIAKCVHVNAVNASKIGFA